MSGMTSGVPPAYGSVISRPLKLKTFWVQDAAPREPKRDGTASHMPPTSILSDVATTAWFSMSELTELPAGRRSTWIAGMSVRAWRKASSREFEEAGADGSFTNSKVTDTRPEGSMATCSRATVRSGGAAARAV